MVNLNEFLIYTNKMSKDTINVLLQQHQMLTLVTKARISPTGDDSPFSVPFPLTQHCQQGEEHVTTE